MGIPTPAAEVKLINNLRIEIVVLVVLLTIFRTVVVAQSLPSVRQHFVRATIITQIENTSATASLVAVFLHSGPHFFLQQQRGIVLTEPDTIIRKTNHKPQTTNSVGRVTRGISCLLCGRYPVQYHTKTWVSGGASTMYDIIYTIREHAQCNVQGPVVR